MPTNNRLVLAVSALMLGSLALSYYNMSKKRRAESGRIKTEPSPPEVVTSKTEEQLKATSKTQTDILADTHEEKPTAKHREDESQRSEIPIIRVEEIIMEELPVMTKEEQSVEFVQASVVDVDTKAIPEVEVVDIATQPSSVDVLIVEQVIVEEEQDSEMQTPIELTAETSELEQFEDANEELIEDTISDTKSARQPSVSGETFDSSASTHGSFNTFDYHVRKDTAFSTSSNSDSGIASSPFEVDVASDSSLNHGSMHNEVSQRLTDLAEEQYVEASDEMPVFEENLHTPTSSYENNKERSGVEAENEKKKKIVMGQTAKWNLGAKAFVPTVPIPEPFICNHNVSSVDNTSNGATSSQGYHGSSRPKRLNANTRTSKSTKRANKSTRNGNHAPHKANLYDFVRNEITHNKSNSEPASAADMCIFGDRCAIKGCTRAHPPKPVIATPPNTPPTR